MADAIHWVDQYLVPLVDQYLVTLTPCTKVLTKVREYSEPQTAWDAWDNGDDMLWVLHKTGGDRSRIVLCVCAIAERVLPIFERRFPADDRPRKAIEAARRYASNPTEENKQAADAAADAAYDATAEASAYSGATDAIAAASAVARATIYATDDAADVCRAAASAVSDDAARTAFAAIDVKRTLAGVNRVAADAASAERKAQVEIIRKYFPMAPIPIESGGQHELCSV